MIQQPDLFSFHNSIGLEGEALDSAEKSANKQEERILSFFYPGAKFTPFEIEAKYNSKFQPIPITSVRRSLTNLTRKSKLRKCAEMKLEKYGKPNYQWELR